MIPGPVHLLLVEDNPADVLAIEACLEKTQRRAAIDVQRAGTLSEALQRLGNGSPDAILLDLNLPDSGGLETLFRVQAAAPAPPVVVLTGMDDEQLGLEAVQRGAQDYLVKGKVDGELLARAVRYAIERKRVEQALAERAGELARVNALLRQQLDQLARTEKALQQEQRRLMQSLAVQDRDRQLVAYEIHDGLVQLITAAKMHLESCQRQREADPPWAWQRFGEGLQLLAEGIAEARRLIEGLRPPCLEQWGVKAAIEYLVSHVQRPGGPTIEFCSDVRFGRLSAGLETTVFRIVQEGLTNAIRHSQSDQLRVALLQRGDTLHIEVEDRGIGFDPEKVGLQRFGIRGMRDRARLFGGSLEVQVLPTRGTRIVVDLPLVEETPAADE